MTVTDRKRIAFISTLDRAPWGGSEELWSRTASRLRDDGHPVLAEVGKWPEPVGPVTELRRKGARILWRHRWTRAPELLRLLQPALLHRVARWRPDFILISSASDGPPLRLLRGVYGTRIAFGVLIHVVSETSWPPDAEAEEYLRYLSAAKACMFVSESSRRLMKAKTRFRLRNDVVVRNPFNVDYVSCAEWPRESGEYRMALVGRLDPGAKGQDVLFEVLAMRKWRERALRVNLYGRGRCLETLRSYGQALELSSVTFCGHQDNVEKIWEENHLLILPSREEGMPLALVEAMLCGRPALVTNVAGMPELVEDNRTGFIAEAPTVRCLDECMERAWERRGDWHRLGQQAARSIREIIPPDPVGEFKEYIVRLMSESSRRG